MPLETIVAGGIIVSLVSGFIGSQIGSKGKLGKGEHSNLCRIAQLEMKSYIQEMKDEILEAIKNGNSNRKTSG